MSPYEFSVFYPFRICDVTHPSEGAAMGDTERSLFKPFKRI